MLLLECTIVGICSSIIGYIIYNICVSNQTNQLLILAFFITGFAIHLVLEFISFNKIICNKHCMRTINILNQ